MKGLRVVLCLVVSCASGCAQTAQGPQSEMPDVAFSEVEGVFARECVMCHQPYDAKGELTLHPGGAWVNVVNVASSQMDMMLVKPGDPEQSYLYRKLTNTHTEAGGNGDAMPFDANLTAEQLEIVRGWIEQGARNN